MVTECVMCIRVVLFLLGLVVWPGFVLQRIFVPSKDFLETIVFSIGFGLAFLALLCPVLDLVWNISLVSVSFCVVCMSGLLFFRPLKRLQIVFKKYEIIIMLILVYGFLLRSFTLLDDLPRGQDAWIHLSFIQYTVETQELPHFVPWAEPLTPVSIDLYPPGVHCIAALLCQAVGVMSFTVLKVFFIAVGTGSCLSSYVCVKKLMGTDVALLSAVIVAAFVPHMIMTTEVIAEAVALFVFPLIVYMFYQEKWVPASVLLGAVILMHHLTAFAVVLSLGVLSFVFYKKYMLPFVGVCCISLVLSASWWSQVPFALAEPGVTNVVTTGRDIFFDPYTGSVSPLFIVFSMIGFFILLKKRGDDSFFILSWSIVLFIASQPVFPIKFLAWRYPAFFVFPCSVMASLGLLEVKKRLNNKIFVLLLVLLAMGYPSYSWPGTGKENLLASTWMQESTLNPIYYAYGWNYVYVYTLSHKKMYEIADFNNPFDYTGKTTYFYDDLEWVPHDITRFGHYDRVYSCYSVVIHRIE